MLFGSKKDKIASMAAKGKQTPKLCEYCFDRDPEIRAAAAEAVGKTQGDAGYNALINLLRDEEPKVAIAAAKALGEMGSKNAIEHLRYMINHSDNAEMQEVCRNSMAILNRKHD